MTSHDILFRFLIHLSVGGPYVQFYRNGSSIAFCVFLIYADTNILDKSAILGLPLCAFAGCSVLTYDMIVTYCLPDGLNYLLALESFFMAGHAKFYWKCTKSILDFDDFCSLPSSQLNVLKFEACG